ncbi:protein FAR1-RELATED SEQUENCE 5-like [Vigna angularis]|uniref:protein FAR1-RELATED SEQUENCE 5-like n=1 Tax=Phaseolus angularis TaxID=3914 RepID=UPI0022B2AE98|nr:protein FAR1-RELATED SEQUENCE 5-like [Vigna angularis]
MDIIHAYLDDNDIVDQHLNTFLDEVDIDDQHLLLQKIRYMDHTNTSLDDIENDDQHEKAQEELNEDNVQPLSIAPTIGMVFETVNEVKLFYRQYAISKGFGIRTRSSRKNNKNELCYFMMVCSRAGKYVSAIQNQMIGRPTCANDCSARMIVSKRDDKWYISGFDDVHSHDLSPTKSRLFRGNKRMNLNVKRTLDLNAEAGVRINKSFRSLVCASGGYENMEFVEHDVRNYVAKQRRALSKDGDAKTLLNHFSSMRELNKDFFYEIDVDDDNRILNVFWADARSRAACEYFGDVISFDTTYLTNKYDMPFAPFVGVNHHGQSILLGCGLLCSEDTNSFVWLFNSWLRCMSNRPPEGIVTDQCKAMKKAISLVFPNTRHRWCLWHIMKKIPEKLQSYAAYKDIKRQLKEVVYNSDSVENFVYGWERMVTTFSLHKNEWLSSLYEERQMWVPCYLRNSFWAGMSTTQRSESMNAFFDGYINSRTTLQEFVKQYDNALQHKTEKETQADFTSLNTTLPCGSQSLIERQFQKHYTHAKFAEIQLEFRGKINCFVDGVVVQDNSSLYKVMEDFIHNEIREERAFMVTFQRDTMDVNCSCLLFEFRGIICRHCVCVLAQERVIQVPAKYILRRWCKSVRRKHTYIRATYNNNEKDPHIERYDNLMKTFGNIAEIACDSVHMTQLLVDNLSSFVNKHDLQISSSPYVDNNSHIQEEHLCDSNIGHDVDTTTNTAQIQSPKSVKRKGRPKTRRLKSTTETIKRKKPSTKGTNQTSNAIGVSGVQSTRFMSLLTSLHNDMQNTQSSTTNIDNVF